MKAFQTQVETSDPWVLQLGEAATNDLEYVNMCHNIENGVTGNNLPEESELKSAEGILSDLSLITLKNGSTLILKDNREIWVPKSERQRIESAQR